MLFYIDLAQEIDAVLWWNAHADVTQGTSRGVNGHFAIEGRQKWIFGLEAEQVVFLLLYPSAIYQVVVVVGIACCG
jgi:hypothetical protein